jgi:hypothetical protein
VANTRKARDVSHLNAAMDQLVARRLATLHRLNDARAPSSQATWATRLARVYGQARRTIASTAGTTLDVAAVTRALRAGEIAYRSLAKAASDGDTRAYTAARQAVASRENDLEGVVGSLAQQA